MFLWTKKGSNEPKNMKVIQVGTKLIFQKKKPENFTCVENDKKETREDTSMVGSCCGGYNNVLKYVDQENNAFLGYVDLQKWL